LPGWPEIGYNFGMTITIDLPLEVADVLTAKAAQEGQDVTGYVRQLAMRDFGDRVGACEEPSPRTPGLHAGRYWIAADFDAPLPDDFWLGGESAAGAEGG